MLTGFIGWLFAVRLALCGEAELLRYLGKRFAVTFGRYHRKTHRIDRAVVSD